MIYTKDLCTLKIESITTQRSPVAIGVAAGIPDRSQSGQLEQLLEGNLLEREIFMRVIA